MLDIQGHTNRELVIVCSHTLTNYITVEEEGIVKKNKVRRFYRLSFTIDINLFSNFFRYKYHHVYENETSYI
jgi:hypothetical protein